jgi:hypothetical protein
MSTQAPSPLSAPQAIPPEARGRYLLFDKAHEELRATFLKAHGDPVAEENTLRVILECLATAKTFVPQINLSGNGILDPAGPVNRRQGRGSSKREKASNEGHTTRKVMSVEI